MLQADILLISPSAQLRQPEINLGVIPGGGGTQRLAHLIGKSRTMELVLTGRIIGANEALQHSTLRCVPIACYSFASWPPTPFDSRRPQCNLFGSTSAPLFDIVVQVKISPSESPRCWPSFNLIQLQIRIRRLIGGIYSHRCHLSGYLSAEIARRVW